MATQIEIQVCRIKKIGKKVDKEWNNDKVDWNAIDAKVESRIIVVTRPGLNGNTIAEITMMTHRKFIISRVWRGEQVIVPQADTVLHTNDNVLVVTNKDEVSAMQILFGKKVDK